ncbi:MAG: TMEM175 family protein, partial [Chloroflexota bacterium]
SDIGYERLVMFTDGIFAIAITLLALEIRVPDVTNKAELGQSILNLLPQIFVFVLSFAQVGLFWLAHYSMFRHIDRSDGRFMTLNLIYLMLVGLAELIIWKYASSNMRLMRPNVSALQVKTTTWRTYYVILIFGASILIAFVSPLLAMFSWLLLLFSRPLVNRYFKGKEPQASTHKT